MNQRTLSIKQLAAYDASLRTDERAPGTLEKYLRDLRAFLVWLDGRPVTKELAHQWKEELQARGYAPVTINSMLSALNGLFRFLGWEECRVKFLKVQRRLFRDERRDLNQSEYNRLLETAHQLGRERLALLMDTICATGIRVAEVRYITVETARDGKAEIALKGKIRTILLPNKLSRKLLKYAKRQKIASGEIFLTRSGRGISRKQVWAEMKAVCRKAGVADSKVFPHNLRHLFARAFYQASRDVVKLADVLGHSSIETTRIYLLSTGAEHARQLARLGLIS